LPTFKTGKYPGGIYDFCWPLTDLSSLTLAGKPCSNTIICMAIDTTSLAFLVKGIVKVRGFEMNEVDIEFEFCLSKRSSYDNTIFISDSFRKHFSTLITIKHGYLS
jgi:hypothetical protein